ncbi:hypothetical protein [Microbacterium sp. BH-3-3-3]|uniref:hypothetical protein n=1 Tax=Microbacterium sp. BH-3-3-3 TaxID=1906742 RepID=UPI000892A4F7|nr:hypothetical protein [Microbacterium sp. BH-3-3-3]AOX46704.1 hypothetical protein BJP65_13620 [Microbacterium sp. BH-3-3-3]
MATLITVGDATIAPQQVMSITSEQASGTIIHPILGRAYPDVTIRPAGLRTGTIEMGFYGPNSEAESATARALIAAGGIFTIASEERATLSMTCVASGRISLTLEDVTRDAWVLAVDYQEVQA